MAARRSMRFAFLAGLLASPVCIAAAPCLSALARRAAMLAVSRCIDDPMARALAGDAAMATLQEESAHARAVTADAATEAGLRAKWLREAAADAGGDQLAVLCAGFDTAAFDASAAAGRRVFEVDDGRILSLKSSLIHTRGADVERVAASITYVPEPLTGRAWAWALLTSGFDPSRRTAWLLPDLSMDDFGAQELSAARTRLATAPTYYSPPGSALVFCMRERAVGESPAAWLCRLGYSSAIEAPVGVRGQIGVVAWV
ncbi:leucine carboxyl methyltransferase-domain-containing protein [Tribonema minus]|uniref:Leucine carboxyl methyltransferase-domain-containing protein n=1 Tax=Tribonema minus TaxID=303371 RepID=A0A835YYH1_9STRA|nr:leucine carboxyl methyltransferase-domain-containing protein [Tribonema minus]